MKINILFLFRNRKNVIVSLVSTVFGLSVLVTGVINLGQRQVLTSVHASGVQLPANISFSCGWETTIVGPGCWYRLQAAQSYSFQRVTNPVRKGSYAARIEVRPGDDPLGLATERSEVSRPVNNDGSYTALYEDESSGTQFYGFSVLLPTDWKSAPSSTGYWSMIFQLHGPDELSMSPAFALETRSSGPRLAQAYSIRLITGDLSKSNHVFPFTDLSDSNLNLGKWTDFVIKIKYAKDATGSVDIWRRNEGVTDFAKVLSLSNVPTLLYDSSVNGGAIGVHYWKTGLYRNPGTSITNVLYLDGMTRGTTFNDVVAEAFPNLTNPTNTPTPTPKIGDLDLDGNVDIDDYSMLVGNFGKTGSGIVGDINGNGKVDIFDYNQLVANFGK